MWVVVVLVVGDISGLFAEFLFLLVCFVFGICNFGNVWCVCLNMFACLRCYGLGCRYFGISLLDEFSGLSVLLFTPDLSLGWIYVL